MIKLSVEVEGKAELSAELMAVDEIISDFSPVWKGVQQEFFEIEREQFESEGAKGTTGAWKELSAAYSEIKVRKYGNLPILQASRRLFKSLTSQTSDSIAETSKTEAVFGTKLEYASRHQTGGGNLPKREPISLSARQLERLANKLTGSLIDRLRRTKFET
jgi:phage gpG-like protein